MRLAFKKESNFIIFNVSKSIFNLLRALERISLLNFTKNTVTVALDWMFIISMINVRRIIKSVNN